MTDRRLRRTLFLLPVVFGVAALGVLLLAPGAQVGGAVLIGPVPVAAGTSPAMAAAALLLLLLLFVAATGWVLRTAATEERMRRLAGDRPPAEPDPAAREEAPRPRSHLRGGGVVMVGPIPLAFGSDPRLLAVLMGLAAALVGLGVLGMVLGR